MGPQDPSDPRISELRDILAELSGGRGTARDAGGDALDQAIACARALAVTMAALASEREYGSARLAELSEMISALVQLDFAKKAPITDKDDVYNGFAVYLNILSEELSATTVSKAHVTRIIEAMTDLLIVTDPRGAITMVNQAACNLTGYSRSEINRMGLDALFSGVSAADLIAHDGEAAEGRACVTKGGRSVPVSFSASVLRDKRRETHGLVCVARDLTDKQRLEEERLRLIESVQRQAIMVEELSAPLLPITRDILVLPLIGSVDEQRASQVTEALLHGVVARRAKIAIIDITGVRAVGAQAIQGLMRAVWAVRLIGAETVLTGISPETAAALVNFGADLDGVVTFGSLERGIIHAMNKRGLGAV